MHGAQMLMVKPVAALTASKIARELRKAERESKSGGTGATIVRMSADPIDRLVNAREIGPEELQSANDILDYYRTLAGPKLAQQSWERVDRGRPLPDSATKIDRAARYKVFADHWSARRKAYGDRTLEILVSAVWDQRAWYLIDQDLSLRHGTAKRATIRGLRDYACRAGWVKGRLGQRWTAEASNTFRAV